MVYSRNRGVSPKYPTSLSPEYLASELNDYRPPRSPYAAGSGVHSLWAWGMRTAEFFATPSYAPSMDDWMVFYPCSEAKAALACYREDQHLETRVAVIEQAFGKADIKFTAWKKSKTTNRLAAYLQAVNAMAQIVLTNTDFIAAGLRLRVETTGPMQNDELLRCQQICPMIEWNNKTLSIKTFRNHAGLGAKGHLKGFPPIMMATEATNGKGKTHYWSKNAVLAFYRKQPAAKIVGN